MQYELFMLRLIENYHLDRQHRVYDFCKKSIIQCNCTAY